MDLLRCFVRKLLLRHTLLPTKPTNILSQHFMKGFGFKVVIVVCCHGCTFLITDNEDGVANYSV